MTSPFKFVVTTLEHGEPAGFDSAILQVPGRWYVTVAGERMLVGRIIGRELRVLSERMAANLGEKLLRAEWIITSDPEQVRTLGLLHDCATCRAAVDQALALLAEHPDAELAVGQLWWT